MARKKKPIRGFDDYKSVTMEAVQEFNIKDYDRALESFLEMEKANFRNVKIHELLVFLYLRKNDIARAREQFDILVGLERERNPRVWQPRTFEQAVEEAGDFDELKASYDGLFESNDDPQGNSGVPGRLSLLYMARGDYARAEEVLVRYRDHFLGGGAQKRKKRHARMAS